MEGDVALDLLHDLVDVTVEHGYRAEALEIGQCARAVLGPPTPFGINRPQWNMGKYHNRGRRRPALEIALKPFELLVAKVAETAGLQIDDIDQANEMHAVGIEAVPARTLAATPVALSVEFHLLVDDVMLARHVVHIETSLRDDALGIVELVGLR